MQISSKSIFAALRTSFPLRVLLPFRSLLRQVRAAVPVLALMSAVAISCTPATIADCSCIVPQPREITMYEGGFQLAGAGFSVDPGLDSLSEACIARFVERLSEVTGTASTISTEPASVRFRKEGGLAPEAYEIRVTKRKVTVKASGLNGVVYAIETLKQLLPSSIYHRAESINNDGKTVRIETSDWTLPCMVIKDCPRFGYRGLMLDVSRHFFTKEEVMKIMDAMTLHKLNRLHLHLTDDQGWRLEIRRYPELTSEGAWRSGTCIGKDFDRSDGMPYGGFYTQEDIREIISYAASRGIEVIPEIDLPGHMQAALATYPELGCTGGPYKVWTRWGISEDVLCVGKEQTLDFLENVLSEVVELFPSEYIHIGGDECPKTRWQECPVCQKKIKELGLQDDSLHSAEHYLQSYVTERIANFLSKKGRKIIGWDEILEGKIPEGATVMSWRGSEGGIAAAQSGHDAIMSPTTHFYFDYYQSQDRSSEPLAIGGYLPIEKVYEYEPDIDAQYMDHILGVQANVWTEYMASDRHLEYMILPRLAALSEVQWCQSGTRDWERFRRSLRHTVRIYNELGLDYCPNVFKNDTYAALQEDITRSGGHYHHYEAPAQTVTPGHIPSRSGLSGRSRNSSCSVISGKSGQSSPAEPVCPAGYEPFFINHYGRHGCRWHSSENIYEDTYRVMQKASDAKELTPAGEKLLEDLRVIKDDAWGRAGQLTARGVQEHKGIAERMFWNYPEVFAPKNGKPARIESRSTSVTRCILSMAAFNERLKELDPDLQLTLAACRREMPYLALNEGDKLLSTKARHLSDSLTQEWLDPQRFIRSLFIVPEKAAARVGSPQLFMYRIFQLASILQGGEDLGIDLYPLFTEKEIHELWRCENVASYLVMGPSLEFGDQLLEDARPLLENFIRTSDAAVSGTNDAAAVLRFGHDRGLVPLLSIIGVEKVFRRTSVEKVHEVWNSFEITPMAANLQFIFYRPEGDPARTYSARTYSAETSARTYAAETSARPEENAGCKPGIKVRILLNEKDIQLPIPGAPFYDWTELRTYLVSKL